MSSSSSPTSSSSSCSHSLSFLELPEDVWRHVALYLDAPDVLRYLCTHRRLHFGLGQSDIFWGLMCGGTSTSTSTRTTTSTTNPRQSYMVQAYQRHLPAVQWHAVRRTAGVVSPREGHLACVMHLQSNNNNTNNNRSLTRPEPEPEPGPEYVCITGGFTDDDFVYVASVVDAATATDFTTNKSSSSSSSWTRLRPVGQRPTFVYGATWTAIPNPGRDDDDDDDDSGLLSSRAVRFGGFSSGGYSNESNEVCVMTLNQQKENPNPNHDHDNGPLAPSLSLSAHWERVSCQNSHRAAPRAYHSTTLLQNRYLVVLGGIMWRESILSEAILDTRTWTWLECNISSAAAAAAAAGDCPNQPTGRHGHSVVLDDQRNRLVLFGGGSGTDLLRSGQDNAQVWELRMGSNWQIDLEDSFPWTWHQIHEDGFSTNTRSNADDETESSSSSTTSDDDDPREPALLSPAESLCLGRCHNGVKISPDTCLLVFGSARPSTNGVLGYHLPTDTFLRPQVQGPLPKPRFTFASAYLARHGYLLVHGGYCSQESNAIGDMSVLDLAPALTRDASSALAASHTTTTKGGGGVVPTILMDTATNVQSYTRISDADARRGRRNTPSHPHYIFQWQDMFHAMLHARNGRSYD
jgi:hypothetical protein